MAFNTAYLRLGKFGSRGLAREYDEITLDVEIPNGYLVTEPSEKTPLYRFVWRDQFGYHLEPADQPEGMIGPMADGMFAQLDFKVREILSRSKGIPLYAVPEMMPVHNRFETQKVYDALSR
jgi:hypothetical protein